MPSSIPGFEEFRFAAQHFVLTVCVFPAGEYAFFKKKDEEGCGIIEIESQGKRYTCVIAFTGPSCRREMFDPDNQAMSRREFYLPAIVTYMPACDEIADETDQLD